MVHHKLEIVLKDKEIIKTDSDDVFYLKPLLTKKDILEMKIMGTPKQTKKEIINSIGSYFTKENSPLIVENPIQIPGVRTRIIPKAYIKCIDYISTE